MAGPVSGAPDAPGLDTLVLWDVDRTLTSTPGVGEMLFTAALRVVAGRELAEVPDFGGQTDHFTASAVLAAHGVTVSPSVLDQFFAAMTEAAPGLRDVMHADGTAMPGAADALATLAGLPGVVQTVVTGNIRPLAVQKLSVFGLDPLIDFEVGGYGSEDPVRATLVRLAIDRARRAYGAAFPAERVVVIGDTPLDVAGARAAGVRVIAVSTGFSTVDDLVAAGADLVLPDLTDTPALVAHILGQPY